MEKSKTNLDVVQRFYDAYNKKDEEILDEVIADDYVDHGHQPPGLGIQGAKSDQREIAEAFQDARFDIDEMIAADDRVVVRWTLHATHTGPFAGLSPTQKKIAVRGMSLYPAFERGGSRRPAILPISSACSRSSEQSKSRRWRHKKKPRRSSGFVSAYAQWQKHRRGLYQTPTAA
jgi:predicted ester cyclase